MLKSEGEHVCVTINVWAGGVLVCVPTRRREKNLLLNQSICLKVVSSVLGTTCGIVKYVNTQ